MATVARLRGNLDDGEAHAHRALVALYPAAPRWVIPALEEIATLAAGRGRLVDAVRVFGASSSWRENMGLVGYPDEVASLETMATRLRADLGVTEFIATWSEGRGIDPRDAVARVQRMRGKRGRPAAGWASLTPAELDVVRLVARGLTNPEVAADLHIARETVKSHLVRVFAKLRVTSRTELATAAARAGLESDEST
jgi:DNA-binding CsgD family transcriptional regulator